MAINITDSGSSIKLEITEATYGTYSPQIRYINKSDLSLRSENNYVYISEKWSENDFKFLYSDITSPSGASADAVVNAIELYFSSQNGFVSTANSTTTLLNAGAVFTGEWEDISGYSSVVITAKTDQNGTYSLQLSPDGTNVDSTLTRYYRTNQIEPPHRFSCTRKYARVVFTNTSASNQTYLRIQTILGDAVALNIPLDATVSQDYDATVVRPTDYHYEVALGRRQGSTTWNKFGGNTDIDIGTETIWGYGGTFARINTASTFTVVSSSVQDILTTGTGAWNVVIYYLDENRLAQTVVVPLNGTTPVVTSVTGLGINRVALYNTGSGDVNAGNITITATTGGSVQAYIVAGEGTTQQCIYFTQDSHQFLVDWLHLNINKPSGGGTPRVTIKGWVYSYVSTAKYLVYSETIDTTVENTIDLTPSQPFIVGEKSILYFEATTDTNNTVVNLRFSGIEIRDIDA
jgi:hypothetical protein